MTLELRNQYHTKPILISQALVSFSINIANSVSFAILVYKSYQYVAGGIYKNFTTEKMEELRNVPSQPQTGQIWIEWKPDLN